MKLHIVYDIAQQSTKDVAAGLVAGLRSLGHDCSFSPVHQYAALFMAPFEGMRPQDISAVERGLIYGAINKIIIGDLALYYPEAVVVVSGHIMAQEALQVVRDRFPGMARVLYLTESPYMDDQQRDMVAGYDLVLCNDIGSVVPLQGFTAGRVIYLPHSFDPEIHKPTPWDRAPKPPDVFFCGTGFAERLSVLSAVDWTGINLEVVGFWPGAEKTALAAHLSHSVVPNKDLPMYYTNAPINLNIHRTTKTWHENAGDEEHDTSGLSVGPRVFEVLACGGFLLTDWRAELTNLGLRDGEHLAVFDTPAELGKKVRHYLSRPEERKRIAANGAEAVRDCSFSSRLQQIIVPGIQTTLKGGE